MEEASKANDFRRWDELELDVLGLIFKYLPLKEILTIVLTVCKSWGKAVMGPYCWREIDIEEWSHRCTDLKKLDRMLVMLIERSCGSLRKLCVSGLMSAAAFSFILLKIRVHFRPCVCREVVYPTLLQNKRSEDFQTSLSWILATVA